MSHWARFLDFANRYGNAASVVSLVISIVGFSVTTFRLWTIGRETKKAQKTAREAIDRLGHQMLAFEVGHIVHLFQDFSSACRDGRWERAIETCHQLKVSIPRITGHPQLIDIEVRRSRAAYSDLGIVANYIEAKKADGGARKGLPLDKKNLLDKMIFHFVEIESRLKHSPLETARVVP